MVRHCLVLSLYPFKNSVPGSAVLLLCVFHSILTSRLTPAKQDGLYRLNQYHPAWNESPVTYCRKLKGCDLWSGFKAPCEHTDVLTERLKPFSSESNYAPLPPVTSQRAHGSLTALQLLSPHNNMLSVKKRNRKHSNFYELHTVTPGLGSTRSTSKSS